MLTRRSLMAGLAAGVLMRPALLRAQEPLVVWGPPAAPSIALALAVKEGFLKDITPGAVFKPWRNPDEMRAGLSSGTMEAVVVPSYAAANLYNRGLPIRLVNILTNGLLYVVAPEGRVRTLADLKGMKTSVPFKNDMPDFILQHLLSANKLSMGDFDLDYSGSPPEALQLLLAGRVEAALLSEPSSSVAIARGALSGKTFVRSIDCLAEWQKVSGRASLPQAGLATTQKLYDRLGEDGVAALHAGLRKAVDVALTDPGAAASASAAALELPAPMISRSLPHSNLVAVTAREARPDLEAFFGVLEQRDARIIGGKKPDGAFYAL